jgi:hypothetical protein
MKPVLLASFCFSLYVLGYLAHSAILDAKNMKPIEIVHIPHILFAGQDLGFQVRVRGAIDEDRQQWIFLCDRTADVCSIEHNERISMVTIEGSAAPKLWSPRPWQKMPPGEFAVVAALGANNQIRVADVQTVSVQGM